MANSLPQNLSTAVCTMTVINNFRKELLPILNGVSTTPLPDEQDKSFKTIMYEEGFLCFPNEIEASYRKALKILRLMSNQSGKLISDKALEEKLVDFLLKLKYGENEEKIRREIDRHVIVFINSIKKMKSNKYLFMIPIMNLIVEGDIRMGDSSIVTLSPQLFESLEATYCLKFSLNRKDHPDPIEWMPQINKTKTFSIVNVEALDSQKALEIAIQKTEICLNILRLYSTDSSFVIRDEFKKTIVRRLIQINIDKKTYTEVGSNINLATNHFPTTLNKDNIEMFNTKILPNVNNLLNKTEDELTPLQGDLLTAILWFGNAIKEKDKKMKFLKGMMALEALLVPDGGIGKLDIIAKRFASIVFSTAPSIRKKQVFEDMRNMYRLRSSIIHSGEGYIYEEDLEKMIAWAQITIQILLERSDKFKDLQETISKEFPIDETVCN